MKCQICHIEFETDDRLAINIRETFVFKPAHVEDPEVYNERGGRVNLAATQGPDQLRELRKDHMKTEVATQFVTYGRADIPQGAFNIRHMECGVQRTGVTAGNNPLTKHAIRFSRTMVRGRVHGGQH